LEIKAGLVSFVGEGTEDWLAKQLDKLLGKLPEFARLPQSDPDLPRLFQPVITEDFKISANSFGVR
jgi:hypothetical protein